MENLQIINNLVQGNKPQEIEIEINGKIETLTMRALTDGEISKIRDIEQRKVNVQVKMKNDTLTENSSEINNADLLRSHQKAKYQAIAWALTVPDQPKVKPEHIANLGKGLPDILFEKVIEISQLTEEDLASVKQFRKN